MEPEPDAINSMMEVTACDEETAREYLIRCHLNLEVAVRKFIDGELPDDNYGDDDEYYDGEIQNDVEEIPPENANTNNSRQLSHLNYHTIFRLLAELITMPIKIPFMIIEYIYTYFFCSRVSQTYRNMHEYIEKHHPSFVSKKENFYGKTIGSLKAEHESKGWKYIVVYVHNHDGNNSFFHNCLESNLSRLISENGGVLFGTLSGTEEANRLRPDKGYGSHSCVIIFNVVRNALSPKLVISDLNNSEAVNRNIQLTLFDMIAEDAEKEAIRNAQNESRRLMEMQNQEYQESLKKDLERIAREKAEKEAAEQAKRREEEQQREHERRIKTITDYKQFVVACNDEMDGPSEVMIRFSGDKKSFKFRPDDKLEKLFNAAISHDKCPLFFQMHLSYPKKAVPCLPKWYFDIMEAEEQEPKVECIDRSLTFEEAGITHGSLIYVDNL